MRLLPNPNAVVVFGALTLLVGRQEGHPACKNYGGWWRWALVTSPDGVAPIRMVGVSASVNLPLDHKSPDVLFLYRLTLVVLEKGLKMVVVVWLW